MLHGFNNTHHDINISIPQVLQVLGQFLKNEMNFGLLSLFLPSETLLRLASKLMVEGIEVHRESH